MNWGDIKPQLILLYSKYVKNNGFVEPDSGSPTELDLLVNLVCQQLSSSPGMPQYYKRKVGATVTLTGASEINLKALFPDYTGIYQVYGINDYVSQTNVSQSDRNILLENQGYSVNNGILYISNGYPTTGTLKIDYRSGYMVEDSAGNRKQYFENDTDVSVLLPDHNWALLTGVGPYVNWKADNASKAQRDFIQTQFIIAQETMFLYNEQSESIGNFLF